MTHAFAQSTIRDEVLAMPAGLFESLLLEIDDLAELKLTLFCLAALQQKEGGYRYLRYQELLADPRLAAWLDSASKEAEEEKPLDAALARALSRGTLLEAIIDHRASHRRIILLNDAAGRSLHSQLVAGEWLPAGEDEIEILPPRPTLYGLYEENIGVLTPMIVDAIRDAESDYPIDWIEDAMRYAVERNVRNWQYIRKVLDSWRHEGRSFEKAGRHLERHKQYTSGEWKDYIES